MKTDDWNKKLNTQKFTDKLEYKKCTLNECRELATRQLNQDVDSDEHILQMKYTHDTQDLEIKIRYFEKIKQT